MCPRSYPDNSELGRWLSKQRGRKGKGTLTPDCIDRLERLGVIWDPLDVSWKEWFQDLVVFSTREGHADVPQGLPRPERTRGEALTGMRCTGNPVPPPH